MSTMDYQLYFDFRQVNIDWLRLWPGFIIIACSIGLSLHLAKTRHHTVIAALIIGAELFILLSFANSIADQFRYYNEKYINGEFNTVEGVVIKHSPVIYGDGGMESFEVNGVSFVYLGKDSPPPYNQTVAKGGKIQEGLKVRILYTTRYGYVARWAILRIEVKQ